MICCLSSQKFGAQKLVYNKNNLRLLTVQKARGSPKMTELQPELRQQIPWGVAGGEGY